MIHELVEKYIAHEIMSNGANTLLSSTTSEEIEKYIESGYTYHVAEIDNKLAGVVGVKSNNHSYHLFVDERHQKRGIARELWQVAVQLCISKGNPGICIVNSSKYALPFYEKSGFIAQSDLQERNGVKYIPMKLSITS